MSNDCPYCEKRFDEKWEGIDTPIHIDICSRCKCVRVNGANFIISEPANR